MSCPTRLVLLLLLSASVACVGCGQKTDVFHLSEAGAGADTAGSKQSLEGFRPPGGPPGGPGFGPPGGGPPGGPGGARFELGRRNVPLINFDEFRSPYSVKQIREPLYIASKLWLAPPPVLDRLSPGTRKLLDSPGEDGFAAALVEDLNRIVVDCSLPKELRDWYAEEPNRGEQLRQTMFPMYQLLFDWLHNNFESITTAAADADSLTDVQRSAARAINRVYLDSLLFRHQPSRGQGGRGGTGGPRGGRGGAIGSDRPGP